MDRHAEMHELHQKANEFVVALLQNSKGSQREIAQSITNLAFIEDNPLRQLFLSAVPTEDRIRPPSPADTVRPRSSHKALSWLVRHRGEALSDRAIAHTTSSPLHPVPSVSNLSNYSGSTSSVTSTDNRTVSQPGSSIRSAPSTASSKGSSLEFSGKSVREYFTNSQKVAKVTGPAPYNCILCNCDLSSKGVCKRHLEDQHVIVRTYECEKCRKAFESKVEAKKHSTACGAGVFHFIPVKPEAKKMYACEFTGERFLSLKTYVDHLVKLCEKRDKRPSRSMHRKLRALLDQPDLRNALQEASNALYSTPEAWKSMRWPETIVNTTIRQLEFATIRDGTTIDLVSQAGQREKQDVRKYLTELLQAGEIVQPSLSSGHVQTAGASTHQSDNSSHASMQPSLSNSTPTRMSRSLSQLTQLDNLDSRSMTSSLHSAPVADPMTGIIEYDHKYKRPLSEHSRSLVPDRQPPGPPAVDQEVPHTMDTTPISYTTHSSQMHDGHTTCLPYRHGEGMVHPYGMAPTTSAPQPMNFVCSDMQGQVLPDTASETTLAPSYHEPELIDRLPFEGYWYPGPLSFANQAHFSFSSAPMYDFSNQNYYGADDASIIAPSISTTQTYAASTYEDSKLAAFDNPSANLSGGNLHSPFFIGDNDNPS